MKKQYDILDKAISYVYLESGSLGESHSKEILNNDFQTKMSDEQKERMLTQLKQKHVVSTFGVLITQKVKNENRQFSTLSEKARIPLEMLKKLASDELLVSSIPVGFVKNLLDSLDIPFQQAKQAILKTFETINEEGVNQIGSTKPAFRKKKNKEIGGNPSSFRSSKNRVSSMNEEKVSKYLIHLEGLFQTDSNE